MSVTFTRSVLTLAELRRERDWVSEAGWYILPWYRKLARVLVGRWS